MKLILSKCGVQVIAIILEVVGIILFFTYLAKFAYILWIGAFITSFIAFLSIVNKDTNPENKIPWISIVLLFPPIGALLYAMFYERTLKSKEIKHFNSIKENYKTTDSKILKEIEDISAYGKARSLLINDEFSDVYKNTKTKYYTLGETMYKDMISSLKQAKKFILLEYFIVEEGIMWNGMLDILKEKAKQGVEIKMMYDDFGCLPTLSKNYDKELQKLGIECHKFNKFTPVASAIHNNRDHRKILVIDGKVGFTGGINLADEYINKKEKHGHWKDGGVRIEGSAVNGLTKLFFLNWDINSNVVTDYQKYFESNDITEENGYLIPFGSGPKPLYERLVGENMLLNIINQAEKYVYITTPYLIIGYELMQSLQNAVLRGVDVTIITPHIPDKKIVHLMTRNSYKELLDAGVNIYEYEKGFIHAKTLLSDDKYAVVGTINLDYRSLVHHYEDAIWMYKTDCIKDIKEDINNTKNVSIKIESNKIGMDVFQRSLRDLIRLFAPMF